MFFLLFFLLVNNIQVILSGHLLRIPLSEKRVTRIRGIAPTLYVPGGGMVVYGI